LGAAVSPLLSPVAELSVPSQTASDGTQVVPTELPLAPAVAGVNLEGVVLPVVAVVVAALAIVASLTFLPGLDIPVAQVGPQLAEIPALLTTAVVGLGLGLPVFISSGISQLGLGQALSSSFANLPTALSFLFAGGGLLGLVQSGSASGRRNQDAGRTARDAERKNPLVPVSEELRNRLVENTAAQDRAVFMPLSMFMQSSGDQSDDGAPRVSPDFMRDNVRSIAAQLGQNDDKANLSVVIMNDIGIKDAEVARLLALEELPAQQRGRFQVYSPESVPGMMKDGKINMDIVARHNKEFGGHAGREINFTLLQTMGDSVCDLSGQLGKMFRQILIGVHTDEKGNRWAQIAFGFLFAAGSVNRAHLEAVQDALRQAGYAVDYNELTQIMRVPFNEADASSLKNLYQATVVALEQA
jgi:hypothetical protein